MWTGIIALVLEVIAFSTDSISRVNVLSISTITGIAPIMIIASKLATNVKLGIITSSPDPIPEAASAIVTAEVPLLHSWE